jgi:hypothetical protein
MHVFLVVIKYINHIELVFGFAMSDRCPPPHFLPIVPCHFDCRLMQYTVGQ